MTKLVRTPSPHPSESLLGFILRVSEANGYESPRYVWDLAGVPRGAEMAPRLPVEGLARILDQKPTALQLISYRFMERGRGSYKILQHPLGDDLRGGPLRLRNPAFCPPCVMEHGRIDAFWDLTAAVACPIHRCSVLRVCPNCLRPISWLRPGILTCRCGGSFLAGIGEPTDKAICEFMTLIQAKLHNVPADSFDNTSGFPLEFLSTIPLSPLVRILAALGMQVLEARGTKAVSSGEIIVDAVNVLSTWPNKYHDFLEQLGTDNAQTQPRGAGLRKQFAGFYEAMFKSRTFSAHTSFLQDEFVRFGQLHWGKAVVDRKLLRGRSVKSEKRFLLKSEVAQQFRIWKPMMDRMIADGELVTRRIKTARHVRVIVDLEKSRLPHASSGTLSARQAASRLGLPVSVLEELRRKGVVATQRRRGRVNAWHLDDVEACLARLVTLPIVRAPDSESGVVAVGDLMRVKLRDAAAKADIVAAALDGRLVVRGLQSENASGILLDQAQVDSFLLAARRLVGGDSYSLPQCAKITGLCQDVVPNAIKMGLLSTCIADGCMRVTAASIERFQTEYIPLTVLASELKSSTTGLLRACRQKKLPVIAVSRVAHSSPQPILRRADERRLIDDWQSPRRARERIRLDLGGDENRLRVYLDDLSGKGQPLPRRAGKPNLAVIARACGFDRNVFYRHAAMMRVLEEFAANSGIEVRMREC
jgi:hypothetical protein